MKKIILYILLQTLPIICNSQIITTAPSFINQAGGAIEITFDASLGNGGLKDYTGTDGIYAHTGVITTASSSNNDWKHAPTWGDNSEKYKLTPLGNNKYKFTITPSMTTFYGLSNGETVTKLAFVFRNGQSTKEGKDIGNVDILIDVYQNGLIVAFTNPSTNQSISLGTSIDIQCAASTSSKIDLKINSEIVKSASDVTTLNYNYNFATANDYILITSATANNITVYDTLKICVPLPTINEARPTGLVNGINYINNSTVTLILHAPYKNNVFLIGEFNDWSQLNAFQLKRDGEYWWITLNNLTPGKTYGYQYLVDGNLKVSDPFSEMILDQSNDKWINQKYQINTTIKPYPEGKTNGLVATFQTAKQPYTWEISNFAIPSKDNLTIYEVLLRDFTIEKSINAAIEKLDYLKSLGITAIELMPIQEFDGNNSWGYNPNHFFAVDKAYGDEQSYKKFIDECHKRGMAVILDMVFNHATGQNPYAKLWWNNTTNKTAPENPYFNVDAPHPYSVFHDFNHEYQPTRNYFKQVLKFWLEKYNIDGYRLDLTKGFSQKYVTEANASNYDQSRIDILTDYYNAAKSVKNDVIFILEHFCSNSEESVLANSGMYLWRNVNNAFSQSAMGYQSQSNFSGLNSVPRQWVGFAESHDEERNFYKAKMYGDGNITTDSIARIKRVPLNIAFTTLLPGPKMIWQFGEMGYDYSINSNGGRTNEKSSGWELLNLEHRKNASDASSKIINLRKLYPTAFSEGTFLSNIGEADWEIKRITLAHSDFNMVVLGNFSATTRVSAPANFTKTGKWYNLFTGNEVNVSNTTMPFSLQAGELLILTDKKLSDPIAQESKITLFPTFTNNKVYIEASSEIIKVNLYNAQGVLLNSFFNKNEIELLNFNDGIYIINVETSDSEGVYKVIKG